MKQLKRIIIDRNSLYGKQYLEKHTYTYENYLFEDMDYPNLRKELGRYSFPRYVIINTKENKVVRSNFQIDQFREILNRLQL